MKILSITAQKPHSTGSGTYMTELVKAFDRMGCRQSVVCGIFPSDEVDFPAGVSCYPVFFNDSAAGRDNSSYLKGTAASNDLFCRCKVNNTLDMVSAGALPFPIIGMSDIMPYTSTRYRDLTPSMVAQFENAFIDAISRAVSDLDPDLIICHHLFLLTALVRKRFPGRKIIGISHGTDLRQMINCDNLREDVRPYIKELDMAFALHDEQRKRIIDIFGMDESRVRVIGSGYNDALFNTQGRSTRMAGDPVRICYAGKISRPKGVPELLTALERLAADSDVPAFELTMAGGCQDDALKSQLDELPPYATWLGQIPQPALAELLRRTDIFVLPSYFEGLPLVLIEAMASGAVPVSTDLPGVKEWIDANVQNANIRYIPMPPMKSIDEPTDEGRASFIDSLADVLAQTIHSVFSDSLEGETPCTTGITWDGISSHILSFCGQF